MTTPISSVSYTAGDQDTTFGITFPYILATFVGVRLNGTVLTRGAAAGEFSVEVGSSNDGIYTGGTITLITPASAGDTITVYRDSGITDSGRLVNFEAGARLLESDLDKSSMQLLHLLQEVRDTTNNDMTITISDVTGLQAALDGKAANTVFGTSTTEVNAAGIVPGPSNVAVTNQKFLRADGAWEVPAGGGSGGGSTTFVGLTDTPGTIVGQEGKFVKTALAAAGAALEFTDSLGTISTLDDVTGTQAAPGDTLVYSSTGQSYGPSPSVKTSVGTTASNIFYRKGNILMANLAGDTYEPLIRGATDGHVLTAVAGGIAGWAAPVAAAGYTRGSIDTASFVGGTFTGVSSTLASTIRFDNTAGAHYTTNAAQFTLEASQLTPAQPSVTDSAIQVTDAGVYLWTCKVSVFNSTTTAATTVAKSFRLQARYRSTDGITVQPLLVSSNSSLTIEPQTYGTLTISYMANMNADSAMVFTVDPHDVAQGCAHNILANSAQVTVQAL
jgi:hypothetical protein